MNTTITMPPVHEIEKNNQGFFYLDHPYYFFSSLFFEIFYLFRILSLSLE